MTYNYDNNLKMLLQAIDYCKENYTHDDLISGLSGNNDLKKQLCIIEINQLNSQVEANLLINNLTGETGPIRETTSFKILELIQNDLFCSFFQNKECLDVFVKAIVDINPSVSRNMIEIIKYVYDVDYLYLQIIKEIKNTLVKLEEIKKNRSYTLNKQNFNLYWNLEALISIAPKTYSCSELFDILKLTAMSNDYTIREKTAKAARIISNTNRNFKKILNLFKDESNIYVKKYL